MSRFHDVLPAFTSLTLACNRLSGIDLKDHARLLQLPQELANSPNKAILAFLRDHRLISLLPEAVRLGRLDRVQQLLAEGVDVNKPHVRSDVRLITGTALTKECTCGPLRCHSKVSPLCWLQRSKATLPWCSSWLRTAQT